MIQVTVLRLFLTLILFAGLISASFAQDKILVEGKGFRDLLVGSSKVDDVIRSLGKPDYVEETKAEYSRNYLYSAAGLKINFHDDRLHTISTVPNCLPSSSTPTLVLITLSAVVISPCFLPSAPS